MSPRRPSHPQLLLSSLVSWTVVVVVVFGEVVVAAAGSDNGRTATLMAMRLAPIVLDKEERFIFESTFGWRYFWLFEIIILVGVAK